MTNKGNGFRDEFRHELNSRWTTEQLRELIESVNRERDKRYMDKFEMLEKMINDGFRLAKEAVASALAAAKEAVTAAFESAKEAITKSETATEKRFESVNEFRSQLKDQQGTFVTRDSYSSLEKRVNDLEKKESGRVGGSDAEHGSRLQQNWNVSTIISIIALAVVVINYLSTKH